MAHPQVHLANHTPREVVTGAVVGIDTNHSQVHAGNAFSYYHRATVAQGQDGARGVGRDLRFRGRCVRNLGT
jgi:hypothetical protein